ncbi:MAG: hypothetical protein A9183_07250 [Dehalococcoides mccartyi]|uniref:DNA polymerase III subunit beta n=1 Tax=Dehalococcoides mccartyi TaxID=61435 RepID=UPI000805B035|nr:DNA polymerase III subunit beta [Dehalococcoides mccartyi]OBW63509.1 MAG: hypothetical protein A9183_07250 [Dehalococcoides mccartyi]
MQIRVDKLRAYLALVHPVVPKKATLPIITHVLLQDGCLIATDLENTVTLEVPEAREGLLLPFHSTMELLKYVPGDEMLNLDLTGKTIKLSWKGGSAAYDVKEAQDYPPVPTIDSQVEGDLHGDLFIDALLAALPYCATESTRPVLTGVTVYLDNVLQIAGADGFRLSFQSLKQSYPVKQTIILSAGTVKILEHLWHKSPVTVHLESSLVRQLMAVRPIKLSLAEGLAEFRFGSTRLIAKPIAGTPPDHLALLNNFREPIKVKLMATELKNAVRRLEAIATDGTGIVRLKWTEFNMIVSARSEEKGEISAEIPVQPESLPGRLALNVKYLLDYLEGKDGLITLGKDQGSSPALLHYGSKPVVAIMPMNVQWDDETPKPEQSDAENAGETEEATEEPENTGEDETTAEDREEEAIGKTEPETVTAGVGVEANSAENSPDPETTQEPKKRRGRRKKA